MQLVAQTGDLGPSWFHVALRTLTLLAGSGKLKRSHEIADLVGADPTYIRKILKELARKGIIMTKGGREGGYAMKMEAAQVTVGDVYRALSTVPLTNPSSVRPTGAEPFIAQIISQAEEQFQQVLDGYTIQDLLMHAYPIFNQTSGKVENQWTRLPSQA